MIRKLAVVVVGLILVAATVAAEPRRVLLRWHGQSMIYLESSKGTAVVFDPHAIEAYGRISVKADVICVSHLHNDHTQVNVVQDFQKKLLLVGLKGTPKKMDWNILDEKYKDLRIRTVGVYHDDSGGMERGKNTVFIVEMDGLRFVHLGDLGHLLTREQIAKIGPVDVLMIPVGGIYTLNGADARKVVEQLKPSMYVIPVHFGTRDFTEVLPVDEFLEEQKKENVKRFDQGRTTNELVIRPDMKPNEPVIAVLNWK